MLITVYNYIRPPSFWTCFFLSVHFVCGENTQLLCKGCIELSGLSFSQPLQLLHCHFPMASYFTIPKLIGFVHMSEM